MLRLTPHITRIRELRAQNTRSSLTYAALECRLAIETVCHHLLGISYGVLPHGDLRAWRPGRVLETLVDEIDPAVVEACIVWMAAPPTRAGRAMEDDSPGPGEAGAPYAIDPQYLNRCWREVSDFLHVKAPKSLHDAFGRPRPESGSPEDCGSEDGRSEDAIRSKIDEIVRELKRIDLGTPVSTGPGRELSFACECGALNRRRVQFLKAGSSVSCSNPDCAETWRVEERDGHFEFVPLTFAIRCQDPACGDVILLHQRPILDMSNRTTGRAHCSRCGSENLFQWRLQQVRVVDHAHV